MNEPGFYTAQNNTLLFSNTQVTFPDGQVILAELHEQYQYPVNGWYWWESESQAREFFQLPEPPADSAESV